MKLRKEEALHFYTTFTVYTLELRLPSGFKLQRSIAVDEDEPRGYTAYRVHAARRELRTWAARYDREVARQLDVRLRAVL